MELQNCESCIGCVNLKNKKHHIFNKPYSKEEYEKRTQELRLGDRESIKSFAEDFNKFREKFFVPALVSYHSTNVSGNWFGSSKNALRSFGCSNVEDAKYAQFMLNAKDAMDHTFWGAESNLTYENTSVGIQCSNVKFSNESWDNDVGLQYCMNCHNSQNLFGCVGMRNAKYCIFNKQYTREEYAKKVKEIRNHMNEMPYVDSVGRSYKYGEFFPPEIFPHTYNESIAQDFFPITKEEAIKQGYLWRDEKEKSHKISVKHEDVPGTISEIQDSILEEVIECEHQGTCNARCSYAFRIIPQELQFYKAMGIPLPTLCFNCRHHNRLKKRTPLKLWDRTCQCSGIESENGVYKNTAKHLRHGSGHCPNEFKTSYSPDRREIVYCKDCYQTEVS